MSAPEPQCPFCRETRLIEPVGKVWLCNVCARTFDAGQAQAGCQLRAMLQTVKDVERIVRGAKA